MCILLYCFDTQDIGDMGLEFETQSLPDDYEVLSDSAVERDR